MKCPKKKIWLSCGIPLVLIGGLFLWLALWANHWENQWETFKRDAEAQGEMFSVASMERSTIPEDENFLEHPWVKSVVNGTTKESFDHEAMRLLLTNAIYWPEDQEGAASTRNPSKQLMQDIESILSLHAHDLEELKQAAARPDAVRIIPPMNDLSPDKVWQPLTIWFELLRLRCWHRWLLNDRSGLESDAKALLQIAKHARSEHLYFSALNGVGVEAGVYDLITRDLREASIPGEQKKIWKPLLLLRTESLVDEKFKRMRRERNRMLESLAMDQSIDVDFFSQSTFQKLAQKNLFVRRVLLARNKLVLCENFQRTLATPQLGGHAIDQENFRLFSESVIQSSAEDSFYERLMVKCLLVQVRVNYGFDHTEENRNDLLQQLSQSL